MADGTHTHTQTRIRIQDGSDRAASPSGGAQGVTTGCDDDDGSSSSSTGRKPYCGGNKT